MEAFRAIRYGGATSDISSKLAPPYDVLDVAEKQAMLARDPQNFVKIDLPHCPAKTAGPPAAYAAAAETLSSWLSEGVMKRDERPAIYVYHQAFEHAGVKFTRKKFFARLKLEPFGAGAVFPHEQTFGGPKEDRLLLTQATRANLSPIFALYQDPQNVVTQRLDRAIAASPPLLTGKLDATENQLWAVADAAVIADVQRLMADKPVYIADGHHRYGTSLNYQSLLAQRQVAVPANHPSNYTLSVFCAMEDAGLLILPTHRVLPGLAIDPSALAADAQITLAPLIANNATAAVEALRPHGPQAVALFSAGRYHVLKPRHVELLDRFEPARSVAWRRLGLTFLHAYLLDRLITPRLGGGNAPEIHYVKSADAAVAEAGNTKGAVFLMQPTTMSEMRDVCQSGDLMPQKSTFFYPKLASGLVVHSLVD